MNLLERVTSVANSFHGYRIHGTFGHAASICSFFQGYWVGESTGIVIICCRVFSSVRSMNLLGMPRAIPSGVLHAFSAPRAQASVAPGACERPARNTRSVPGRVALRACVSSGAQPSSVSEAHWTALHESGQRARRLLSQTEWFYRINLEGLGLDLNFHGICERCKHAHQQT
jgi:hypothetical protein